MLSSENNDLICRNGPGTRGNRLFRSIWLPALLSAQLPHAACPPVRLKLLGEELVAIRDGEGRVGILAAACAHRRAPLFFGRPEAQGLRCAYHGWLYDVAGRCVETPNEPNPAACAAIKLTAYATAEKADIVWVYMGEGEAPALPRFPWIDLPAAQRNASVWLQETNWFQGAEGEIDSSHVSVLHRSRDTMKSTRAHRHWTSLDPTPRLWTKPTRAGFLSIARRRADDAFYWRVTQWMAPMFSFIPSAAWPIGGRAWVPIDDENTYCWDFTYDPAGPLGDAFFDFTRQGLAFPPQMAYGPYRLNTGAVIDVNRPLRNADNDYRIDRDLQQSFSTTGIHGVNDQDRAVQEGMGRIVDRSREYLVAADLSVVAARRRLLAILETEDGLAAFRRTVADGSAYGVEPLDVVAPESDVDAFVERFEARICPYR